MKEKTKFTGCESLETSLVKDGLVIHHQRDDTNPFLDGGADDALPSTALSLTAFSRLNLGEKLASLRDAYPEESLLFEEESPSILAPELTMQNLMAARPADLQAVFPKYPVEKFAALKKRVFEIYRAHRTKEEVVFEEFNKSLASKQRKALELVYMGEERKSEPAKQLGISVDTLKNRLKGAVKKLKAAFPEYAALKKSGRLPPNFKTDLSYDGFYRKSSAALVRPVRRLNPKTNAWEPVDMAAFLRSRKQRL